MAYERWASKALTVLTPITRRGRLHRSRSAPTVAPAMEMTSENFSRSGPNPYLVSIGVPVYNAETTIEAVVEDLRNQTYPHTEIIISDNASTDDTAAICRRLATSDQRIRLYQQPENVGAEANFRIVLQHARGRYFMWAAADDRWQSSFVQRNLEQLLRNVGLVGSISRVLWLEDGVAKGLAPGTAPLDGTPRQNIKSYVRRARDNSRFYGLFDRAVLAESLPPENFYALDLAIMVGTLMRGRHAEVQEVLMSRNRNDPASYISCGGAEGRPAIHRWFPLAAFTKYLLFGLRIPITPTTIVILAARNLYEHLRYAALRRSPYGRLSQLILRIALPLQRRLVDEGSYR